MNTILQDVSFAVRSLRRRRAFAIVAIITIALGIGAATSIYTVVDGVLFRPLPDREPERLIAVWQTFPQWRGNPILDRSWDRITLSIPEFRDWQSSQRSFRAVAIWSSRSGISLGFSAANSGVRERRRTRSFLLTAFLGTSPSIGVGRQRVEGGRSMSLVTRRGHTPERRACASASTWKMSWRHGEGVGTPFRQRLTSRPESPNA
ncbi:MAG: hypothetical protein ABIT38_21525 [Gemmatimonadaceae bacterium]